MAEQPNDAPHTSKLESESLPRLGVSRSREPGERGWGPLDTPRRYDQPIEDDDDPVMPSDDATLNTKI